MALEQLRQKLGVSFKSRAINFKGEIFHSYCTVTEILQRQYSCTDTHHPIF